VVWWGWLWRWFGWVLWVVSGRAGGGGGGGWGLGVGWVGGRVGRIRFVGWSWVWWVGVGDRVLWRCVLWGIWACVGQCWWVAGGVEGMVCGEGSWGLDVESWRCGFGGGWISVRVFFRGEGGVRDCDVCWGEWLVRLAFV